MTFGTTIAPLKVHPSDTFFLSTLDLHLMSNMLPEALINFCIIITLWDWSLFLHVCSSFLPLSFTSFRKERCSFSFLCIKILQQHTDYLQILCSFQCPSLSCLLCHPAISLTLCYYPCYFKMWENPSLFISSCLCVLLSA